jgi:cobaltochelatase CobN
VQVPQQRRPVRNLVTRADGKLVNVARKMGQLFVCASGCCCGHTEHGFAAVPMELYHTEWERRRLRPHVHLSMGGCLGPCPLANVVMLLFDGRSIWFHSFNSERQVLALYDYVETLIEAQTYLPPPPELADFHFTAFSWDGHGDGTGASTLIPLHERAGSGQTPPRRAGSAEEMVGGFVFLTHADTDLLALARVVPTLGPDFPPVRAYNITHLKTEADAHAYVDRVTAGADIVVLRLLGGSGSFRGGFGRAVELAQAEDQWLICLPGTDTLDPELTAASNVGAPVAHEAFAYLQLGGLKNVEHLLRFLSDHLLTTGFGYDAPEPQPRHGVYYRTEDIARTQDSGLRTEAPTVGILFYRSHLLSGNTEFVDALIQQFEARGARVVAVYTSSLQDYDEIDGSPELENSKGAASAEDSAASAIDSHDLPTALRLLTNGGEPLVDAIVTTTSFAVAGSARPAYSMGSKGPLSPWERGEGEGRPPDGETDLPFHADDPFAVLGVPVVQAIAASGRREQWADSQRGLTPTDVAMNVAIPELDGRIISVPVSFKGDAAPAATPNGSTPATGYVPEADRVDRVVGLTLRLAALRRKPNREKRVAFLLTDYNAKASRVAAAVGLDTPTSLLRILAAMQEAGYGVENVPESGDALLHQLIERASYDREVVTTGQLANAAGHVPPDSYADWFGGLPPAARGEMTSQWGDPPGRFYVDGENRLALAGLDLGNAFVAIQPPRGYGMDPAAIYHLPDLPPPHTYHALYRWLAEPREQGGWGADAVVHVGKHGTLEWLPGKGVGLSADCYPDLFLGDLPLVYPFIINNPGEGAQAKRRSHAVIVDHLTPPMTTAEGYGEVEELTRLVDEYYQLEALDPTKLPLLQQQIWDLIQRARLDSDLGLLMNRDSATHTHEWDPQFHEDGVPYTISDLQARDFAHLVENINGYLCELTSAQIRDGLHVLGQAPEGEQLVDTLLSLVRLPNLDVPSLRAGVADSFHIDLDEILDDLGRRFDTTNGAAHLSSIGGQTLHTHADVLEAIDATARRLLATLAQQDFRPTAIAAAEGTIPPGDHAALTRTLRFVCEQLVPNLRRTDEEIANLLWALDGRHVPAGPSGAPTRGMAQVLPTGRNFYTVDPRGLPSAAAWMVGQRLADELITRYLQDEGTYPERVGLSIWGTSLMRTHGDDVAEVMALIGVRPRWQSESRRLVDVEVIPLEELGRPRVDVVCRISGFFRDAFPDLIALLDRAFASVAELDEPLEQNAIRRHVLEATAHLGQDGLDATEAARRARYRIFGSPPGAYGAGILPLIDERNWRDDADLAEVYVNWGGYAYGAEDYGVDARGEFRTALAGVQAAIKNQDNREHDIFDSDDYFQYHGGMIAAIRALGGKTPRRYFGDSADPQRAKVRDLREEALRVFRTRVVNPKWIASIQRHGYKGALELAATVDYLFGYDATSDVVEDWMYEKLTESYALDPGIQQFFRQSNPWAQRDLSARLLEAMDRGLWREPTPEMRARLQATYLSADADVEARVGGAAPRPSDVATRDV